MRITTVVESLDCLNGRGRAHHRICLGLAERGHQVTVLARDTTDPDRWLTSARRVDIESWPDGAWSKVVSDTLVASARGVRSLRASIVATEPDVVYVPQRLLHTIAALGSRRARVPAVAHLHDTPRASWDRQDRWAHRQLSRLIAVSEAQADAYRSTGVGTPIDIVHNGIDTTTFRLPTAAQRGEARRRFGVGDGTQLVAFSGRVLPEKGVDVLLRAFSRVATDRDDAHLLIAGFETDADYSGQLRQLAGDAPVTWAGVTDPVHPVYWAADVVVSPSTMHDAFPLAPLEAMACGTPVVVSAVGGLPEGIPAGHPDWIVPAGDEVALAAAIDAALALRAANAQLPAELHDHIASRFAEDVMVDHIERILLAEAHR